MARYTGPVCRICRRLGTKLMLKGERCFGPKCGAERRGKTPPGGFGQRRARRLSDRGIQIREKQRVRYTYGVLERQFVKNFKEASRQTGLTGENLLILMETRLDNVAFRLGFGNSRSQSRQIVRHGHITVNGKKVDIPSYIVKAGDIISWKATSLKSGIYKILASEITEKNIPVWLSLDSEKFTGKVVAIPTRSDIDATIEEQLVVEYYSR
ncbi:MAG: 30S ribosomal protein S4 [Chloroflexi bacterium]|nr:30S ribosomal protein S4 [Chloroflexota bacterium]